MMSELTLTVLRLGLLVGLWAFVFAVVGVLRGDLYGTRVNKRAATAPGRAAAPAPSAVASADVALATNDAGAAPPPSLATRFKVNGIMTAGSTRGNSTRLPSASLVHRCAHPASAGRTAAPQVGQNRWWLCQMLKVMALVACPASRALE